MALIHDERSQLDRIEQDLQRLFTDVAPITIRAEVLAGIKTFNGARVRTYVPVLVQKRAKDHLRHLRAADPGT